MKLISTLVFLLLLLTVSAQDSTYKPYKKPAAHEKTPFWDKCYSGGDLMLYGGNNRFYFNVSPLLGYRPNNKSFSYGIGLTYQYSSFIYYGATYKFSIAGARVFIRQDLGNLFFVHGELENYFTKGENIFTREKEIISIPCANVFIGYKQKFSDFSYYYIMVGYEAIGDRNTGNYVYPMAPLLLKAGYILDLKGK